MPEYMIGYHGQSNMKPPASPEEGQAHMQKWQEWLGSLGDAVVNPGTPLGESKIITQEGIAEDDWPNTMFGFTVVSAGTLDEAVKMAQTCPVVDSGGSLRIIEMKAMPG